MSYYRAMFATLTVLTLVLLLGGCKSGDDASDTGDADAEAVDLSSATDIVLHNGVSFALIDCQLVAVNADTIVAQTATGIDGTCEFARKSDASPQLYGLGDRTFAFVVASTPHEDDDFCDTAIRAVRLDADRLNMSAEVQNILMCTSGPFDEAMISTLSHSVPPN